MDASIQCHWCREELAIIELDWNGPDGDGPRFIRATVKPCKNCLAEAEQEGMRIESEASCST